MGALVLVAGSSAVLSWVSLTMVALLDEVSVLLTTLASVVVATRVRGSQRRLALLGGLIAVVPIPVVAAFLATSEG